MRANRLRNRVGKAIAEMMDGEAEEALFQICAAIEATAKVEYGAGGKANYKRFISENVPTICCAFGYWGSGTSLIFPDLTDPEIKPDANGEYTLEHLCYAAFRCGAYHPEEATKVQFTSEAKIFYTPAGILTLPDSFISGMILAVVLSPANAYGRFPSDQVIRSREKQITARDLTLQVHGQNIPLNNLWGKRQEWLDYLQTKKIFWT